MAALERAGFSRPVFIWGDDSPALIAQQRLEGFSR